MSETKAAYSKFLAENITNVSVFCYPWWLDAVSGSENWDAAICDLNGKVMGVLPYTLQNYRGFNLSVLPQLTQKLGPILSFPTDISHRRKLSLEKEILDILIRKLPTFHLFRQTCDYDIQNWLPFYWHGFKQTTQYTYVVRNIQNENEVLMRFSKSKRKEVRRSQNVLNVEHHFNYSEFYDFHEYCLSAEGKKISYDKALLARLCQTDTMSKHHNFIVIRDASNDQLLCALFLVSDARTTYNLISAIRPVTKTSGASSLAVYEALKLAMVRGNDFDFEGSMLQNVEHSFRQFGGIQQPLQQVEKFNNRALYFITEMRRLFLS